MKSKPTLFIACLIIAGVAFIFEDTEETSRLEAATQNVVASRSGSAGDDGFSGTGEPTPRSAIVRSSDVADNANEVDSSWYEVGETSEIESQVAEAPDAASAPVIEDYDPDGQASGGSSADAAFVPAPTVHGDQAF